MLHRPGEFAHQRATASPLVRRTSLPVTLAQGVAAAPALAVWWPLLGLWVAGRAGWRALAGPSAAR